jgi:hypothetical protein
LTNWRFAFTLKEKPYRVSNKRINTSRMNKPQKISLSEWKEIIQIPVIRESWGLDDEPPDQFADMAYGVKFNFFPSSGPGYAGDLYILHGDALGEPMTLIRRDGKLVMV